LRVPRTYRQGAAGRSVDPAGTAYGSAVVRCDVAAEAIRRQARRHPAGYGLRHGGAAGAVPCTADREADAGRYARAAGTSNLGAAGEGARLPEEERRTARRCAAL